MKMQRGRGSNGLHLAAETYAAEVAKVLIKAGCPLDQLDKEVSNDSETLYFLCVLMIGQHSAACSQQEGQLLCENSHH